MTKKYLSDNERFEVNLNNSIKKNKVFMAQRRFPENVYCLVVKMVFFLQIKKLPFLNIKTNLNCSSLWKKNEGILSLLYWNY